MWHFLGAIYPQSLKIVLTKVDKVQGPKDSRGPMLALHTKLSNRSKFTRNLAVFTWYLSVIRLLESNSSYYFNFNRLAQRAPSLNMSKVPQLICDATASHDPSDLNL